MDNEDILGFAKFMGMMISALCLLGMLIAVPITVSQWQGAKAQAAVYAREGVYMTASEIFWGAAPMRKAGSTSTLRLEVQ